MCGILVIYSKKKKLNKAKCENLVKLIHNRGPDKTLYNYFNSGKLFIANSILSIVGKIKKNKNLYHSKKGRYFISFNGEIYNHKNLSQKNFKNKKFLNDTELLANLFEIKPSTSIPRKLDGMFAYALYDKKKNKLQFSTDVQGEKKLFYYDCDDFFIASSNITPILKYSNDIDYIKLKEYFETRHFLFLDNSIYQNINYFKEGYIYNFNLNKDKISKKKFDDPLNWINKKIYSNLNKLNDNSLSEYFLRILKETKKKMEPEIPFGSLFSGGIDSSIQSKLLSDSKNHKEYIFVDHGNIKDPISNKINKFKNYLNKKLTKINLTKRKYFLGLKNTYNKLNAPFHTHDLVGIDKIFMYAKKKKLRVIFNAGGVDELWGGYRLYEKINWDKNVITNLSPYSSFKKILNIDNSKSKQSSDRLWLKAYNKYRKFLNVKESKIQASLFTDYFVQGISVHNFSWHLLSGENSVEIRNIFINKSILSKIINVPLKHKINMRLGKKFILKKLLKKIFVKLFSENLIYGKQGFSGFPNESSEYLNKYDEIKFNKVIKMFKSKFEINRDIYWKLLNIFYFKKYIYPKISFEKIIK